MFNNIKVSDKPSIVGFPLGLDKCKFYCRNDMQNQWVEINTTIIFDCIVAKFCRRVKVSLIAGKLVVTEFDESMLPKFKKEEDKTSHLEKLEHWEQKPCAYAKYDFIKFSREIQKDLSIARDLLNTTRHAILSNRLEAEPEFQLIVTTKTHGAIKLHQLVKKS